MGRYVYQTKFELTNPVNDFDAAQDYLQDDDMSVYLKDALADENWEGFDVNSIESIVWDLKNEQAGTITLTTAVSLLPHQLDFISDWVSGQCSDGLGEGFEQQPFAEIYDEDEWGDPDESTFDMASFDWETNPYKFKLISANESKEPIIYRRFVMEAVDFKSFDVRDYQNIQDIRKAKSGIPVSIQGDPREKSLRILFKDTSDADMEKWVNDYLKKNNLTARLEKENPAKALTYTVTGIKAYVKESVTNRGKNRAVSEAKADCPSLHFKARTGAPVMLKESSEPTEAEPLKVDAPRGEYWIWKTGSTIYGSVNKPDPNKNIVNARSIIDFSAQGFETVDEVVEYVKKYF